MDDGTIMPVSDAAVHDAIRTLISWSGDNPDRENLRDTPARVVRAWREYCAGYAENPAFHLNRTFKKPAAMTRLCC